MSEFSGERSLGDYSLEELHQLVASVRGDKNKAPYRAEIRRRLGPEFDAGSGARQTYEEEHNKVHIQKEFRGHRRTGFAARKNRAR